MPIADVDILRTRPRPQPRRPEMERTDRSTRQPTCTGSRRPTRDFGSLRRSFWCTCLLRRPYHLPTHGCASAPCSHSSAQRTVGGSQPRSHHCCCCHAQDEGASLPVGVFFFRNTHMIATGRVLLPATKRRGRLVQSDHRAR